MAKNILNLNTKERYEYLFNTYKACDCCGKIKTYNCFYNKEKNKFRKTCKTCENRKIKHEQFKMVMDVLNGMDIDL